MQIIEDNEITYRDCSKLREIFVGAGLFVEPPPTDGSYDDRVTVKVEIQDMDGDEKTINVIVWPTARANELLHFRVILLPKENMNRGIQEQFSEKDWKDVIHICTHQDQNFDFYGSITLKNLLGVTLEYMLDTTGGILKHNIVNTAKRVANGAQRFTSFLSLRNRRVSR